MEASRTHAVYDDVVEMEARRRGFNTDVLPALRQYQLAKQRGDAEAVGRIGVNLRDFFASPPNKNEAA